MKKVFVILFILMLICTAASAQEFYTLPEIREQAAAGWHKTYTDKYGRETVVDIDVEVFGEDVAPVLKISHVDYKVNMEMLEEGAEGEDDRFVINKNNPYASISGENRKDGRRTDIYASKGKLIDLDEPYLADYENNLTVGEVYDFLYDLLEKHGIDKERFIFDKPEEFYAICSISKNTHKPVTPGFYLIHLWTQYYGMPVLKHAMLSFRDSIHAGTNQGWPMYTPLVTFQMRNENEYSVHVNTMDEVEKLADDIPLCSFDTVIEKLGKQIEAGSIQRVFSLKFGYVLYNEPGHPGRRRDIDIDHEADYYAVPSWLIECAYMDNPKENFTKEAEKFVKRYQEDCLTERDTPYVGFITINAQTGEMIDPMDRSKGGTGDADYKSFIPWDKVK